MPDGAAKGGGEAAHKLIVARVHHCHRVQGRPRLHAVVHDRDGRRPRASVPQEEQRPFLPLQRTRFALAKVEATYKV